MELDAVKSLEAQAEASQQAWLKERRQVEGANMDVTVENTEEAAAVSRTPLVLAGVVDDYDQEVKQEVMNDMQRQAKVAQQDEINEHEMRESLKLKKA